eukprot:581338-Hanusia_phi.AAC.8
MNGLEQTTSERLLAAAGKGQRTPKIDLADVLFALHHNHPQNICHHLISRAYQLHYKISTTLPLIASFRLFNHCAVKHVEI